jgi:hypothetical protein
MVGGGWATGADRLLRRSHDAYGEKSPHPVTEKGLSDGRCS